MSQESTPARNGPNDHSCNQKMKITERKWPLADISCVSDITAGILYVYLVSLISQDNQLRPTISSSYRNRNRDCLGKHDCQRETDEIQAFVPLSVYWAHPMDRTVDPGVDHSSYRLRHAAQGVLHQMQREELQALLGYCPLLRSGSELTFRASWFVNQVCSQM